MFLSLSYTDNPMPVRYPKFEISWINEMPGQYCCFTESGLLENKLADNNMNIRLKKYVLILFFKDLYLYYLITLPDLWYNIKPLIYLSEACMLPVEVLGVFSVMTDKKLGAARISSCMSH